MCYRNLCSDELKQNLLGKQTKRVLGCGKNSCHDDHLHRLICMSKFILKANNYQKNKFYLQNRLYVFKFI